MPSTCTDRDGKNVSTCSVHAWAMRRRRSISCTCQPRTISKLAFHPGFALSATLPRLLGSQKAALMLLTSRRIKGEEAVAMGLADELVPLADVRSAAHKLAAEIAEGGPLGVLATRKTLRTGLYETVRDTLAHEHEEQWKLRATEDHQEGIRSVAERRPGNFKGR